MDWQNLTALGIVALAAWLLVRPRLRRRAVPAGGCTGCSGCGGGAPTRPGRLPEAPRS